MNLIFNVNKIIKKIYTKIFLFLWIISFPYLADLPRQEVNNGTTLVIPEEVYSTSGYGWQGSTLVANGMSSRIIVDNNGKVIVKGEGSIAASAARAEKSGYIDLGNGSEIDIFGNNNAVGTGEATGGVLANGAGSLVEANNLNIKVKSDFGIGIWGLNQGEVRFNGLTNIEVIGDYSEYVVRGVSAWSGSVITLEDANMKVESNAVSQAYMSGEAHRE